MPLPTILGLKPDVQDRLERCTIKMERMPNWIKRLLFWFKWRGKYKWGHNVVPIATMQNEIYKHLMYLELIHMGFFNNDK